MSTSKPTKLICLHAPQTRKTRICLYGSKDVVTLLAAFERAGGMLKNEKQREAFVSLVTAMRCDPKVDGSEINTILFGARAT
jgi:hypothetical protein